MSAPRPLIFNAFEMNGIGYYAQGSWTHPDSQRHRYKDLDYWVERARFLDEAGFTALFFADVLGVYDVYRQSPAPAIAGAVDFPLNDPFMVIPAMLAATRNLSFAVTASTTYEHPFTFARRFGTLDHLSKGRIAWNVVTSYLPNAARNYGLADQLPHEARYARAEEFLTVFYKLLEGSWEEDAVLYDKAGKRFADPDKVHRIDHQGEYFSVQGPALTEPSVQRTPVIFQAGASSRGLAFAARHAEVVFVNGMNPAALRDNVDKLRTAAVAAGRAPDAVKVVTDLSAVIGRTREEAERKANEIRAAQSPEAQYAAFGGASGFDLSRYRDDDRLSSDPHNFSRSESARFTSEKARPDSVGAIKQRLVDLSPYARTLVGTPESIADDIDEIARITGVDGFNLHEFVSPRDFSEFAEQVLPVLSRRGLFQPAKPDSSLRNRLFGAGDRLAAPHPAADYRAAFAFKKQ
ncbi:NtaA/DmoA family FMN-dependent monooxygenase [Brenneria tiliae]|uniref:NtaA/DmoA family FMN-dependent monooxygenase n=1 Tax=Brenneria tiliae TaxID=2914984 RepID=UPI002014D85B|nr:NtaA/DmoA family FMN-dependent monooxygenase [Brenneria tiliae]MCL2897250.1 NtaA/DmoA family FMN-dependent monooxygenase [Brenneria tiliae]MCL2904903.1 NtaA/DmoA family FMN-dependent monooxygenase [Brenneria tiliae]